MKRLFITVITLLCSLVAFAQSERTLEFYYIEHARTTPISKICSEIQDTYSNAMEDPNREVYIYLANGDTPLLVKCEQSNQRAVDKLVNEIMSKNFHPVFPESDLKNITEFFNNHDFVTDDGSPKYDYFILRYYVNPSFWMNGFNETVIAQLSFVLDLDKLSNEYFSMEIYHPKSDDFEYEVKGMFGTRALCPELSYFLTY